MNPKPKKMQIIPRLNLRPSYKLLNPPQTQNNNTNTTSSSAASGTMSTSYPSPPAAPGAASDDQPEVLPQPDLKPKWLQYMETRHTEDELEPTRQERGMLRIIHKMFSSPASDTEAARRATDEIREYYIRLYKKCCTEDELLRGESVVRLEEGEYRAAGMFLEHAAGFVLEMARVIGVEEANHERIFEFLKGFRGEKEERVVRAKYFDHRNPKFLYDPEAIGRAALLVWKHTSRSVRTGINPNKEECLERESFSLILARLLAADCLPPRHAALLIFDIDLALGAEEQAGASAQGATRRQYRAQPGQDRRLTEAHKVPYLDTVARIDAERGLSASVRHFAGSEAFPEPATPKPATAHDSGPDSDREPALALIRCRLESLAQAAGVPSLTSSRTVYPPPPSPRPAAPTDLPSSIPSFLQCTRVAIAARHILIAGEVLSSVARKGFDYSIELSHHVPRPVDSNSSSRRRHQGFTRISKRHYITLQKNKWAIWFHRFRNVAKVAETKVREWKSGVPVEELDLQALGLDLNSTDESVIKALASQVTVENVSTQLVVQNAAEKMACLWPEAILQTARPFPDTSSLDGYDLSAPIDIDPALYSQVQIGHSPASGPAEYDHSSGRQTQTQAEMQTHTEQEKEQEEVKDYTSSYFHPPDQVLDFEMSATGYQYLLNFQDEMFGYQETEEDRGNLHVYSTLPGGQSFQGGQAYYVEEEGQAEEQNTSAPPSTPDREIDWGLELEKDLIRDYDDKFAESEMFDF